MTWAESFSALGAVGFGAIIGWFVYYINRYRKGDVQFSDLTTVIAIIGGGVVIQLFDTPWLFGAYGIGLFLGFFGYFVTMVLLIRVSPNFDADFLLDGRRRVVDGTGYYIPSNLVRPAMDMPSFQPELSRPVLVTPTPAPVPPQSAGTTSVHGSVSRGNVILERSVGERGDVGDAPVRDPEQAEDAKTRSIDRVVSADFPLAVEPESENLLSYAIAKSEVLGGGSARIRLEAPADVEEVALLVSVQASDFDVLDPDTGRTRNFERVMVNLTAEDAEVRGQFLLRAHHTDADIATTIYVRFSHANLPVGLISLSTKISSMPKRGGGSRATSGSGSLRVSLDAAPAPDLVIHVNDRDNGRFEIAVDRGTGTQRFAGLPLGDFPVTGNAWTYAMSVLAKFSSALELRPRERRQERIDGLGLDLWWQLPEQFRDFYWEEMHGQDLSVAIHSEEPYIPWELIKPQRDQRGGEMGEMLGLAFPIGRWKQGRHFPDPLTVSGFAVIAPQYAATPLTFTAQEASELGRHYGARLVKGEYAAVSDLLRSREIQAIHFAGHGHFDPSLPDASRIELADSPLIPSDLRTATIGRSDRPLVFLNACQVGNQGWSLTQIGGWADAFCDVGCSAFVGPYWDVNDLVARKVSLLFYEQLRGGRTVGQAMQAIRRRFWTDEEFPYDPTWLAYSLHCHPNVTVRFAGAAIASRPTG